MKRILKNLTIKEFFDYCEDIGARMESETTYWGQMDEHIPYYEDLKAKHIYGKEKEEHEVVYYVESYNEDVGDVTFDIFEQE